MIQKLNKIHNLPDPSHLNRALIIAAENRDKLNEIIDYLSDKEDPEQIMKSFNAGKEASKGEMGIEKQKARDTERGFCWGCGVSLEAHIHDINCPKKYPKTGVVTPPQQEESRGECDCGCHKSGNTSWMLCEKCQKGLPQLKEESPRMMTFNEFAKESKEFQDSHCLIRGTIYADVKCPVYSQEDCPECNKTKTEESPEYKTVGFVKPNLSGIIKNKRVSIDELTDEESPKENEFESWKVWDKLYELKPWADTEEFIRCGKELKEKVKDHINSGYVSKEKIKRLCDEQIEAYDIASDYDSGVRNGLKKLKESLGLEEL